MTGITEKRLANKRFRKSEEAILKVFLAEDTYVSMGTVASKAGIARSTAYHHHRSVRKIIPDYEKYVMRRYKRMIRKVLRAQPVRIRTVYMRTLYFVIRHKKIFKLLVKYNRGWIFEEMIDETSLRLVTLMRLPKNSQTLFAVYKSEVSRLLYEWGNCGFDENEVEKLLAEIMYLTDTARARLGALLD